MHVHIPFNGPGANQCKTCDLAQIISSTFLYGFFPASRVNMHRIPIDLILVDNRSHVGVVEFKKLNWLPTKERVYYCICVNIFKFFNDMSPECTSEVFRPSYRRHNTRASTLMLDVPFRKYCSGQTTLYPTSDQEHEIRYQLN